MSQPARLTAFDIAALYGVTTHSLRFYEEQGILVPMMDQGKRYYTSKDRLKLELILKGKRLGYSFLELKLLILETIQQKAERENAVEQPLLRNPHSASEDLAEEIWQVERKIGELQSRVRTLHSLMVEAEKSKA